LPAVPFFDSCRLEMISYRSAMEAFAECHQTDGQPAQEKAGGDETGRCIGAISIAARARE